MSGLDHEGSSDEDLTPLAYARRYGLISNHSHAIPSQRHNALPPSIESVFDADDSYCTLDLDPATRYNIDSHEKWDVDRQTAGLLASVLAFAKVGDGDTISPVNDMYRLKAFKSEDAILAMDPELDLLRLESRNKALVSTQGITPFKLNQAKGEALEWSTEEIGLQKTADILCRTEKLEVNEETVQCIAGFIRCSAALSLGDLNDLATVEAGYESRMPAPLTPPLMPLSPPPSPEMLAGPVGDMTLTSTPEDLCATEAAALGQQIAHDEENETLKHDTKSHSDLADAELFDQFINPRAHDQMSSSPLVRKALSSLRVDTPLIPTDPTTSPAEKPKMVSFPADLHTIIPSHDSSFEADMDAFSDEIFRPFAEKVGKDAENEKLVEIDTTMRVEVPPVAAIDLDVPWKSSHRLGKFTRPYTSALRRATDQLTGCEKKWSGVSKVEQRLSWTPFPSQWGRVRAEDAFDDGSLARYMQELTFDEDAEIGDLLWKPDTLSILEADEADEIDLEAMTTAEPHAPEPSESSQRQTATSLPQFPRPPDLPAQHESPKVDVRRIDMSMLLRKRKLELDITDDSQRDGKRLSTHDAKRPKDRDAMRTGSSEFAGMSGLSSFMHLYGHTPSNPVSMENAPQEDVRQIAPPAIMLQPKQIGDGTDRAMRQPLAAPQVRPSTERRSVVVSSKLLQNRHLIRQVQTLLPSLDLVERDAITPHHNSPGLGSKYEASKEADITISPSTGLIMTTLQKLKQKPLPGQNAIFGIHDRIAAVATRYERLIILISESQQVPGDNDSLVHQLDESDSAALSDLTASSARLPTDIEAYYIPSGDIEGLSQWIAALIQRYSTLHTGFELLHDETLWERLLRFAGFNAYAAQAVLAELKCPDIAVGMDSSASLGGLQPQQTVHGLAAFMQMSGDERVQRFGGWMGGERALGRVSSAIERGWHVR